MCARILRREAERLGYKSTFSIYDADDAKRLVKRCLSELNLDDKRYTPDAMARAEADGAVVVPPGENQAAAIREITGGRGVDAAFDFVGVASTIRTAQASMAQGGRLTVVGIANGIVEWSFFATPWEATLTNTYWGTIEDLYEVVAMYRVGQIRPLVERFSLDDALEAYRRLEAGELSGRAVVAPNG